MRPLRAKKDDGAGQADQNSADDLGHRVGMKFDA